MCAIEFVEKFLKSLCFEWNDLGPNLVVVVDLKC